jgi:SAM-dependent methyltransferase
VIAFVKQILGRLQRLLAGREMATLIRRIRYAGLAVYCPVCGGHYRGFQTAHLHKRPNSKCPVCGTAERHRLAWVFLQRKTNLFDGTPRRLLHVAPNRALAYRLKRTPHLDYLTANIEGSRAMVQMDVMDIQYPDESFDAIMCSHVLEHVVDDRQALREFFRVLRPGGWAALMVPVLVDTTYEDPSITDPAERERVFGQSDHVRIYGPDFADRVAEAGFNVSRLTERDIVEERNLVRWGVLVRGGERDNSIFFCQKFSQQPME